MDNSSETIESMVYPNPFNTNATIQFENTSATAKTVVEIFSMDGAKAAELYNGETEFGQLYKIDWDASSYPNGLYMYRITCGDQVVTGRMMHQDSK